MSVLFLLLLTDSKESQLAPWLLFAYVIFGGDVIPVDGRISSSCPMNT